MAEISDSDLPESRLYTFVDAGAECALYFLEGQRLIRDLALLQEASRGGFPYFRDAVLSFVPLIALIKRGEQIGLYIDSQEPYFRLKIEAGHHGDMRSTLVPEELDEAPDSVTGLVRTVRVFPNNRAPYVSVLEAARLPLAEIVNRVLAESYQVSCAVRVADASDQCVMLHALPALRSDDVPDRLPEWANARADAIEGPLAGIFSRALLDGAEIVSAFRDAGFRYLADRPVRFRCNCSRERMVSNLLTLSAGDLDSLFAGSDDAIEVRCDYCKTRYRIGRTDLEGASGAEN